MADSIRKAAATAKTYGVTLDELNGYTAAIGSTTRESGSIIGNSLKTIFSRITTNDSAIGALESVGVSIKDIEGNVRPVSDILEELSGKWNQLSDAQRQSLGINVAGGWQQTRFLAMMNNWGIAVDATTASINSQGSAMKEQEKYVDSLEARLNRLDTAWNKLVLAFGEAVLTDGLISGIETLNSFATAIANVTKYTGVLPAVFGTVGVAVLALSAKFRTFATALIFGTGQLTAQQLALTGLSSSMTTAGVAAKGLTMSLRGLAVASGVGVVLAGIGFALEKLISSYSEAKQAQEDFKASQEKGVEALTTNKEETEKLLQQYEDLTEAKKNAGQNWGTESEQEYLQVQNKLAEIYPQLISYLDGAGNAHLKNKEQIDKEIEATNKLIEAKKKATIASAKDDISKSMSDMNDVQGQIDDAKNPYMGESYDPWGLLPKLTLSAKEATEENEYHIQMLQNQWSNAAQKINATILTIADAYSKLEINPNIRKSVDDFVSSLDFSEVEDPEKLEAYSKKVAELTDKMQKALEDGNEKAFNAARDSLEDYTNKIVDTDETASDLSVSFDDVKKATEDMTNATYAGKDGLDGVGDAMENAASQAIDLSKAIKDADGDFAKITSALIEATKAGQAQEVVLAAQGDAYKALADEISPLNELLEKMAQGKQISAAEAMELIAQEEELANAISIENGQVKINQEAVAALRDAKVSSYETTMKLIKEEMMQQSKALLEKLGMYKAEIEAIQSVADAKAKATELAQQSAGLSDGDYAAGVNLGMQQNELLNLAKNLEKIDQLTSLASTGLTQVGTSAEKLSESSDKVNDKTKESIYISDEYKLALDAINTALDKQRAIKQKFAEYSKEYQNALKAEIDLLKQQKQLVDSQAKSLQSQIASGNILKTGIVDAGSVSYSKGGTGALTVVSSGNYSLGDVRNISSASGSDLNKYLTGKLSGMGDVIANAARANGIDPGFLAAIAMHESGKGTSNAIRNKNNAFGIMTSSGIRSFSSLTENINYAADMLRRLYINQGLTTVEAIQKKYAPIGASNDPTSLNKYWVNGINTFWKQFTGSITSTAASVGNKVASGVSSSVADYYLKNFKITSEYGEHRGNTTHKGVDFANGKQGDPVKAIRSGKVITATYSASAGNWVVVQQDDGTVAKYMHMMNGSLAVKAGDNVVAGQQLGKVGNTGQSTGAHLHLQVERNGQAIDPLGYLKSSGGTYSSGSSGASQDFTQEAAEGLQAIDEAKSSVLSLQQESLQIEQQIQELYLAIVQSKLAEFDHIKKSYDVQIAQYDYLQSVMDENGDKWLHVQMNREAAYVQQIKAEEKAVKYLQEQIKLNNELTEGQKALLNDNLLERQQELFSLEQKLYDTRYQMANDIVDTYKKALEAQKDASTKVIDDLIDEINKKADESDYKKKLADAQKSTQEIQDEITALSLDDSTAAKKRIAELQKELADQNESIAEIQADHNKQLRIDNLNTQKETLSEYYDNILNNEEKFAKMREKILALNGANIVKDLTKLSESIQKNKGVLGSSVVNNLIDLINRANSYMSLGMLNSDVIKKITPAKFDSGGATGSWGSSGKLAVLHEKEIVLNKDDTSNFLKAINLTRSFFGNLVKLPDFKGVTPATAGGNTYEVNFYVNEMTGSQSDLNTFATKFQNFIKSKGG